jgi:RES domain-containing protein
MASAAHAAFDGEGARRYGSRWTPRGIPAVFTSAMLSLAALERFVHTDSDLEPTDLLAIPVEIRDDIASDVVEIDTLPGDWRTFPSPPALAEIGERWFRDASTPVLSVPSVVIPHERNFVLNPTHREFAQIVIGRSEPFSFDPRMWKR